ncbi:substrate-binding periplasmic protein [Algicola sagamiensis]|uniref:substrate-binding periplasmic protein n=1 Tax=Algicola sagamiensis TaxID=163869 RepID=UPI00035C939C|nr:transporter substrate-binding domain-containing protein [Algicola sagamiensis]
MARVLILLCAFFTTGLFAKEIHFQNETILFCGETGEWPPFNFFERKSGEKTALSVGYDIDIARIIFSKHQLNYKVVIKPWKRCLSEAIEGKVHVVFSASTNPQRDRDYLLSTSYYSVRPILAFGPKTTIEQQKLLLDKKAGGGAILCGRTGYNYANFGFEEHQIKVRVKTYGQLIELAQKGRCTAFLARYEPLHGQQIIDSKLDFKQLEFAFIPGVEPEPFYMLISRNYEFAYELKGVLDEGIYNLKKARSHLSVLSRYIAIQDEAHPGKK